MATHTFRRVCRASFALPLLAVATVFGLAARGVQAVPHAEVAELVSRATTVQAPPSTSFFLNGLKGQPPQTRHYDFVVSEMTGAPDGVTKSMLVVNGTPVVIMHRESIDTFQVNGLVLPSRPTKATDSSFQLLTLSKRTGREPIAALYLLTR